MSVLPLLQNLTLPEVTVEAFVTYKSGDGHPQTRRFCRGAGDSRRRRARCDDRPLGCRARARGRREQGRPPGRVRLVPRAASVLQVAGRPASSGPTGSAGRAAASSTTRPRSASGSAPPKQGVDFSGTNVQEEGVDEPDIVKTDGNTLFALANGKLNAVDVSSAKPRLLDTLTLDPGQSHELLLHGDRLLVLSRGGYWAEPMPAMASRMMPYAPAQSVARRDRRLEPESAAPRPHADPRRGVRRCPARRRQRADRRHLAGAQHAAVRAAQGRHEGGARRGGQAQPRRCRLVARRELAAVVPDQATGS